MHHLKQLLVQQTCVSPLLLFYVNVILMYIGYLTFIVSSWIVSITESSCSFFTTAGSDKVDVKDQQIQTKLITD